MSEKSQLHLGVLLTVLGVALFSTIELVSKNLFELTVGAGLARIDGYALVVMRFLVTGLLLTACGYPSFRAAGKRLDRHAWDVVLKNGVVGVAVSISLFHFGIDAFKNSSSAAVVFSANALFTIILARFMNAEAWTWRKWLAVAIGMCGISCFIFEGGRPSLQTLGAILMMVLSAIGFAYSVCLTRREIAFFGPSLLMGLSSLVGAVLVLPVAVMTAKPGFWHSCATAWLPLSYLVLVGTALGYYFYYAGIRRVTAFLASMIFLLKPVLACVFAGVIRHEMPTVWTGTGTVLIVGALLFTAFQPKAAR